VSNYPEWWNTTITVYNKYEDPTSRRITWHKAVLHNCFWKNTGNKLVVGETVIDTDSTLCRIPVHPSFLEKYEWNAVPDKSKHFTLGAGDIIIKGDVAEVIDEYNSGCRSSDILTKYKKLQGCMVIDKYAINAGLGRGLEHYFVKGV
jgi:hypothetical protein